ADAARRILNSHGLSNVNVEYVSGKLSDHFDPRANVVRLSDSTYNSTSVAAIGVAAHECGHAIQYATGYAPIKLRNSIVPVVNIGNALSMPLFFIGLILGMTNLAFVGAMLFGLVLLFQLITLPVEFNASRRALKILDTSDLLYGDELKGAKKVLTAAAMTYVAAVASTALQLLRLLLILNRRRD
ncbi:MAG: zinc metallopeptidase, partial [Clostridia bacterium]|nr:zinc metallopeptidase [Clostridia bacterium]